MQYFRSTLALSALLTLLGCGGSETSENFEQSVAKGQESAPVNAKFDPANQVFYYPNDAVLGQLSALAGADSPNQPIFKALDAIDGFGLINPIAIPMTRKIEQPSAGCGVQIYADDGAGNLTATPSNAYNLAVLERNGAVAGSKESTLVITPLVPMSSNTQLYIAFTDDIKTADGSKLSPAGLYGALIHPTVNSTANPPLNTLAGFRQSMQAAYARVAPNVAANSACGANLVTAWSAKTQTLIDGGNGLFQQIKSAADALVASQLTAAQSNPATSPPPLLLSDSGSTLGAALSLPPSFPGANARIFAGSLAFNDYLSGDKISAEQWLDAEGKAVGNNATSAPKIAATSRTPALAVLPPASVSGPYPITVFIHGITRDRSDMLAVAGGLAAQGIAVIAIDQPTHGIVDTSHLLHASKLPFNVSERHESADLDGQPGIDGSGSHFYELSALLTTRDHLRQSVADQLMLRRALPTATFTDSQGQPLAGTRLDTSKLSMIAYSLGASAGSVYASTEDTDKLPTPVVLAMPTGALAQTLVVSNSFKTSVLQGLAAQGVTEQADIASFVASAQTTVDSVDPVNHITLAKANANIVLFDVTGDQTVPNSGATSGYPLVGSEALVRLMGLRPRESVDGDWYFRFLVGNHGTLLQPNSTPNTQWTNNEIAATTLMHQLIGQAIVTANNGAISISVPPTVTISNGASVASQDIVK